MTTTTATVNGDLRIVRGAGTGAYQEGYKLGREGLPLIERPWECEQGRWLRRNGHEDGTADRKAAGR